MALTKAHNQMIAGSAVNVIDYGAVGDGTTDDTADISLDHAQDKVMLTWSGSAWQVISSSNNA